MAEDELDQDEELDDADNEDSEDEGDEDSDSSNQKAGKRAQGLKNRFRNIRDPKKEKGKKSEGQKGASAKPDSQNSENKKPSGVEKYAKGKIENKLKSKQQAIKAFKKQAKDAAKKAAKDALKKAAQAALKNPYVLIGIAIVAGVLLIILIIVLIIVMIFSDDKKDSNAASQLALTITGPDQAKNGDLLPYQINATYPGTAQDIIVTNRIPDGTDYVSSSPVATFDPTTRTASWSIKAIVAPGGGEVSNLNTALTITLRSTRDNTTLINMAQGTVIGELTTGTAPDSTDASLNPNL